MYQGWITSAECNLSGYTILFAPKIGYEWNLAFVGSRISTGYYTDFQSGGNWRICPAIGISFLTSITLYSGYNIKILTDNYKEVGTQELK